MTTVSPTHRPLRSPDVSVQQGPETVVVAPSASREEFLLNPTAFALWELCDGHTTVEEMVNAVWQLFAVSRKQAEIDVAAAMATMRAVGLIT